MPVLVRFPALVSVLVTVALAACGGVERRGDANLQLSWEVDPAPPQVGPATVAVVLSDVDWTPHNGATVILTGFRDSVQLVVDTARGQGAGRYETDGFVFEVAGDWLLNVRVETNDGRWAEFDHSVTVVAEGS